MKGNDHAIGYLLTDIEKLLTDDAVHGYACQQSYRDKH